jgi:hypothetical protein
MLRVVAVGWLVGSDIVSLNTFESIERGNAGDFRKFQKLFFEHRSLPIKRLRKRATSAQDASCYSGKVRRADVKNRSLQARAD